MALCLIQHRNSFILFFIQGMWHGWEMRGVCIVGKPEGRSHWGDPGIDGNIILRWIFRKWDVGVWTGLGWFRIETGDGHL
jgi:hypothetical protein